MTILDVSSIASAFTKAVTGAIKRLAKPEGVAKKNENDSYVNVDRFEESTGQKIELTDERKEYYKTRLEEMTKKKQQLIIELLGTDYTKDTLAKKDIRVQLAKLENQNNIIREALGLPPGKIELEKEFSDFLKERVNKYSEQKAELFTDLENLALEDALAKQDIRAQLAKLEHQNNVIREVLGLPPGKLELSDERKEYYKVRLQELSEDKDQLFSELLAAGENNIKVKNDIRLRLARINAKTSIIKEALTPGSSESSPKSPGISISISMPNQDKISLLDLANIIKKATGATSVNIERTTTDEDGEVRTEALGLPSK